MIRKTLDTDIPAVMAIYDAARAFMRAHGNTTQWPEGTPSGEQLAADTPPVAAMCARKTDAWWRRLPFCRGRTVPTM